MLETIRSLLAIPQAYQLFWNAIGGPERSRILVREYIRSRPGDRILLDDGRIRLAVLQSSDGEVTTRVEEGGPLGEHKGINLPGVKVSIPSRQPVQFAAEVVFRYRARPWDRASP